MKALVAAIALAALGGQPLARQAVEVRLTGSFGAVTLINNGPAVRLRSALKVERETSGQWKDTGVANLRLVTRCTHHPVPACTSLAAGARFEPAPWTGRYCSSQCPVACDLDSPVPPGTYRFSVITCDGRRHFESPPFEKK